VSSELQMKLKEVVMIYFWVPSWRLPIGTEKPHENVRSDGGSRGPRSEPVLSECVDIATGYGMDDPGSTPGRDKRFYLLHRFQTGSGAQPASCPMRAGG
jgi:hypothetical protein